MNIKPFYINIAIFILFGWSWVLLDILFNNTTDKTDILIISFFVVWNYNISRKSNQS